MPLVLKLALRFLSLKRGGLARFTTIGAALIIAIGVFAFLFALTLSNAFERSLISTLTRSVPHIVVTPIGDVSSTDLETVKALVGTVNGVQNARFASSANAMITANGQSQFVLVKTHENMDSGVVFGDLLASKLQITAGEEAELLLLGQDGKLRRVRIRANGISSTGLYQEDAGQITVSTREYAAIVGQEVFTPQGIEVHLAEPMSSETIAAKVAALVGNGFEVLSWERSNLAVLDSIRSAKRFALTVVSLLAAVGILGLLVTTAVLVRERSHDISVLRTMGLRSSSIASMVLLQSAVIALSGSLPGIALLYLVFAMTDPTAFILTVAEGSPLRALTVESNAIETLFTVAGVIVLSVFAGLFPAMKAARVKPLANLRQI
ncbi:MAG: ABC transporter permease [Acidobacteria bacterium]|nr:ABC transporter permease [Acidobacteriota bacterium]